MRENMRKNKKFINLIVYDIQIMANTENKLREENTRVVFHF